jgi:hypothetical protein
MSSDPEYIDETLCAAYRTGCQKRIDERFKIIEAKIDALKSTFKTGLIIATLTISVISVVTQLILRLLG